jgi:CBS domain containing-hemolysin-like protein
MLMRGLYRTLETSLLGAETTYQHPEQHLPMNLTPDSPAIDVMTDLRRVAAQAVSTFCGIDQATERMKNAGVRLLFVINQSYEIQGILTSQDILDERVVKHMNAHNTRREDVTVRDLMTPQAQVEVLQMYDVARATVGDLIRTFRQMGRQHALVVEEIDGKQTIRGILSTTQIAKQTGIHVDTSEYAGSFAELQASIS